MESIGKSFDPFLLKVKKQRENAPTLSPTKLDINHDNLM